MHNLRSLSVLMIEEGKILVEKVAQEDPEYAGMFNLPTNYWLEEISLETCIDNTLYVGTSVDPNTYGYEKLLEVAVRGVNTYLYFAVRKDSKRPLRDVFGFVTLQEFKQSLEDHGYPSNMLHELIETIQSKLY